ncbi:MAG: CPBP family intramembrane glutamic endopeptidase [Candidatus Berkiellales bacterium]
MNTRQYIKKPKLAKPWIYFLATYAWTWFLFGIAYLMGISGETGGIIGVTLVLLALSGPTVTAVTLVYVALNKEGRQDYWRRIIDYKCIPFKWYFVIFLLIPAISVLAAEISGYWDIYSITNKLPSSFLAILIMLLVPTIEELGWRGYVQDRLQEKYNALTSSLILGTLWGFWHLPVFFLQGSSLSVMSFASFTFWLYMINLIALSICFTWIYNNSARSTLSAILFHITLEFSANTGLIPWDRSEHLYNVMLWVIVAFGITVIYGAKTLVRKKSTIM